MKILNLYAGIGGNRNLWGNDHEITAVENVQAIADVYKGLFPSDTVVVGDAHQYLLDHHKEFDFIWSSPPCPSHSRMSTSLGGRGIHRFPDMKLYEEIIFLKNFYKGNWVIENVIPYYKPLIQPVAELDRHLFWSNRHIPNILTGRKFKSMVDVNVKDLAKSHDIELPNGTKNQRKLLRNAVDPQLGLHIFQAVQFQKREKVPGEQVSFSELAVFVAPRKKAEEL